MRPSGTEPKLKFYLFASEEPAPAADLPASKIRAEKRLDNMRIRPDGCGEMILIVTP